MKPKILIFIDWFIPGYKAGGPIKSVANIISNLYQEFDFSIVTSCKDFGDIYEYDSIIPNIWIDRQEYRVLYLNKINHNTQRIREILEEEKYDVIYFNSLFSIIFTLLPLLLIKFSRRKTKVLLAPRGMLGGGALRLKKEKKLAFLIVAKAFGFFKDIYWHASTDLEAIEIRKAFGRSSKVLVAKNIASKVEDTNNYKVKTASNTSFFFLSRITPKKNLLGAIEAVKLVKASLKFRFDIIGPIEDKTYWDTCVRLINDVPPNVEINFLGDIPNYKLQNLLKDYHFLLLPTFNENYGHVIIESWSAGCPVILSDQTPWNNLEKNKVGWNVPLKDNNKLVDIIEYCIRMEDAEFQKMRQQIKSYVNREVITENIIEQNRKLFYC